MAGAGVVALGLVWYAVRSRRDRAPAVTEAIECNGVSGSADCRHESGAASHGDGVRRDAVKRPCSGRRRLLPVLVIAVGVLMCLAPIATDLYFRLTTESEVTQMTDTAGTVPSGEKERLLAQARAYNARLGG